MAEQQNLSEFKRYLTNNQNLIKEKHTFYFKSIDKPTLKTVPTQTLIEFIYDIFCISKYRQDPKTSAKINSSLKKNINDFMLQNPQKIDVPFDPQLAVETLMWCIQNNEIFHVEYDPKDKNGENASGNKQEDELSVEVKKQQLPSNSSKGDNQVKVDEKEDKTNVEQAQMLRSRIRNKSTVLEDQQNEFDTSPERIKFNISSDLIKKNAKIAFLNYCKNQMEVGGRKTFDQLQEEASTMTIGKLLVYAKTYGMFNNLVTKHMLMQKFKRISEGKRSIDFEKYYVLLTQLVALDNALIERLQLNDENLYKKVKFANYPFHTQDQNPRELVANRNFIHKITSHSGKTEEQLRQDLMARKLSHQQPLGHLKSLPKHHFRDDGRPRAKDKMLSPKDLSGGVKSRDFSIELSFIDKIVQPEDNDLKYLGDYEIEHYRRGDDTGASVMLRRKGSIVENIRKRIQQIENHQNGKMAPQILRRRYQHH